ncbi:hypothetical protein ABZP36_025888 [Zizania latifolia]
MEEAALAPPAAPSGSLAAAAALSGRRAHLESASYRALSRLFSHCLHLHPSRHAGRPDEEVEHAAANSLGDSGGFPQVAGSPQSEDARLDWRKNLEVDAAYPAPHETPSPSPLGVPDASLNSTTDPGIVLQGTPGSGIAGVERVEGVEEAVLTGSTSGKAGDDGEELGVGAGLKGEDEALRSMNACLDGEVNELVKEMVCNDDGHLLLDAMMTNLSGLIDDASAGTMSAQSCGASGAKLLHDGKVAEEVKELGDGIDDDRYVDNVDHGPIDGGGFEEGEIEGDIQNLFADDSGNSELEDEDANGEKLEEDFVSRRSGDNGSCGHDVHSCYSHLMPQKGNRDLALNTERNSKDDSQMHVTRAQTVSYDEIVDWNETPLPGDEVLKHGNKRKRTLTEERKAKKTKNKRIKRAQQREAEGVKRLKLQPVIKPKVVQYCRYYLLGKCQQGSICKFSHDTTPLTKSKPCTHFARGSCLKGDDCPYDHELSKYPCHNFLENGMCIRGDKCKFSHEIQTTEGPSTPDTKKSDVSLVPDKANRWEQTSSQKASTIYNGEPVTSAPTKHHSILKSFAGISENAQKASVRIPKGIQFLPFNKARSDSSILHQDVLSTEKHKHTIGGQHQKFGGPQPAEGEKIANHSGLRSAPLLDEKNSPKQANLCLHSEPKKNSLPTTTAVPGPMGYYSQINAFLFNPQIWNGKVDLFVWNGKVDEKAPFQIYCYVQSAIYRQASRTPAEPCLIAAASPLPSLSASSYDPLQLQNLRHQHFSSFTSRNLFDSINPWVPFKIAAVVAGRKIIAKAVPVPPFGRGLCAAILFTRKNKKSICIPTNQKSRKQLE